MKNFKLRTLKSQWLGFFFLIAITVFITTAYFAESAQAAVVCQNNSRTDGLLTSYDFNAASTFGNRMSKCIVDPRTYISTQKFKYADLLTQYFTKARSSTVVDKTSVTTDLTEVNLTAYLSGTKDVIVNTTGTVRINNAIAGTKTGIFFIDGNLEIQSNITYGTGTTGVVFVVNGDVTISRLVSNINAVIMSNGTIYSTWDFADPARYSPSIPIGAPSPLLVNGSLVSLDSTKPLKFNRTLNDNSIPAEQVLYQPKFLIIIKGLMTDTITYQKEVTVSNFSTPFPTAPPPGPGGTPVPTATPGPAGACPSGNPIWVPFSVGLPVLSVSSTCTLSIYP